MKDCKVNDEETKTCEGCGASIHLTDEDRENILKLMLRVKLDGNEAHEFVRLFDKVKYGN